MRPAWVAGSTRAQLLLGRRIDRSTAGAVAAADGLESAVDRLVDTQYSEAAASARTLEDAQRAVASVLLLELRLLAGWLPRGGAELLRSLGAWFELVNIEDRLTYLHGGPLVPAFELGAFASAWTGAAGAATPNELREALRASAWADPGGDDAATIHLALRLAWARRIQAYVPEARAWVGGALALLAARDLSVGGTSVKSAASFALRDLGDTWREAATLEELARALPPQASWVLTGAGETSQPWQLETAWWRRVGNDAEGLVRRSREGRAVVVGTVALLSLDAVRVAAALAAAAVRGDAAQEVVDALF